MRLLALALLLGRLDAPPDDRPLPASTVAPLPAGLAHEGGASHLPSTSTSTSPAATSTANGHAVAHAGAETQHPPTPAPPPPAANPVVPWSSGERMDFDIDYLGIGMGKSTIAVGQAEEGTTPVSLESHTTGLMAVVKFRQVLVSRLDPATLLPTDSKLEAWEPGDYHHVDTARFARAAGLATVREVGKFDKTYEIEVPEGTLDFVGLVFRLRTLPLEDGARHEFRVLAGRTVSKVVAEVVKRERIKVDAGRFDAVKVKVPTGLSGKFSEKNPTYVWFTDDARRIVVRIATDFSVGGATANLKRYTPGEAAPASP